MGQAGDSRVVQQQQPGRASRVWSACGIASAVLLMLATACSTVETRRADPATLDITTTRSLAETETCLSDGFDRHHLIPHYRPTARGGSYVMTAQTYVAWGIDLDDDGDHRRITVHAVTSIWGKDRKIIDLVQACV